MRESDNGQDGYDEEELETGDAEDAEVVPAEPDEYAEGDVVDQGPPDVFLDVPVLNIDEIHLDVQDLRAHVSLKAEVLDLLKLNVGADVALGRVELDIKGVEAQAQLKVRLHNVATIVNRVLTTIDRNPEILEQLTRGVGQAAEEVGSGARDAVKEIGRGTGDAAESVGRGAGAAVEDVGHGAGEAVEDVGEGAGDAVENVGEGAGETVKDVGKGAGDAVGDVGEGAGDAVGDVGEGAGDAAGDVGEAAGETVKDVGESADDAVEGVEDVGRDTGEKVGRTAAGAGHAATGAAGKGDTARRHRKPVEDGGARRRGAPAAKEGRGVRTARRRDAYKR
ncbi:hypothetical protein [Streptomyces sp. NPDC006645]|uniref:hypothetical protein n=1 Tax=unclassified Streptomyces TaxID=2593676 RepID=UPI0033BC490C